MAIPEAIAGAPRLREDLRWVWDAFSDLTTERAPSSMGGPPGHIPWRAMHAYCAAHGIRGETAAIFVDLIKAMDDAYLDHVCRQMQRKAETGDGES